MAYSLFDPAAPCHRDWTPEKVVRRAPAQPTVPLERLDPKRQRELLRLKQEQREEEARRVDQVAIAARVSVLERELERLQKAALASGRKDKEIAAAIVEQVALEHGVTVLDIKGPWRNVRFWRARHAAYYRLRTETSLSYPAIGRLIGGKDHTTILKGVRKHARLHGLPMPGDAPNA
jgi:chromosomal replication initiation ATPase DnaA